MFLVVNCMITFKRDSVFTEGGQTAILIGATPGTLFQGTKVHLHFCQYDLRFFLQDALGYWPMISVSIGSLLVVISIPEILMLAVARSFNKCQECY